MMQYCCNSVSSSVVVAIVFEISCILSDLLIDLLLFDPPALSACLSHICKYITPADIHGSIQRLSCCIGRITAHGRCCVCSAVYVVPFRHQICSSSGVIFEYVPRTIAEYITAIVRTARIILSGVVMWLVFLIGVNNDFINQGINRLLKVFVLFRTKRVLRLKCFKFRNQCIKFRLICHVFGIRFCF